MNNFCADIGYRSVNKFGEQLCGDHVDVISPDDHSTVIVLADGLGSGVKASILSTLTAKIISTMMAENMKIEDCVATIAATLPVCAVRGVAYSTFTIIRLVENEEAEIIQYDNPMVILFRDGKYQDIPSTQMQIDGKTILAAVEKVSLADEMLEKMRAEHEADEHEHEHHDHDEHEEHDHCHHHHDHDDDDDHDHDHCCHHHDHEEEHEHHHDHDHDHDHNDHDHEHHHRHDGEECDDPHCGCHHHHHHADEVFTSWGEETVKPFTEEQLHQILTALDSGDYGQIVRAKGIVPNGEGKWLHFDYVPEEHEVRFGPADYTGRLCVIGANLDEHELHELFGL